LKPLTARSFGTRLVSVAFTPKGGCPLKRTRSDLKSAAGAA